MPLPATDVDQFLREGRPAQIKDGRSLFLIVCREVGGWKSRSRHGDKVRNHWIGPAPAVKLKDARAEWGRMEVDAESIRKVLPPTCARALPAPLVRLSGPNRRRAGR